MKKILVIGQTPPPYGGQAIMIDRLLAGTYGSAALFHVRSEFSRELDEMGKIGLRKLLQPFSVVARAAYARLRHGTRVLYYAPSGPDYLPMLRDFAILIPLRWMFDSTIFHFHAAGTSELYERLPAWLRTLYRLSYFEPEVAIRLSDKNPDDPTFLRAQRTYIVPNGVADDYAAMGAPPKPTHSRCRLLYVGLISLSKGFLVLVDAVRLLKEAGVDVDVSVVGRFASDGFRQTVEATLASHQLHDRFRFHGVLTGREKHQQFLEADVFCFPTFFESESFGLVVVEAMQFATPVVAARWRGVQSLVRDGDTGFLVPPRDSVGLADRLLALVRDSELRSRMGQRGRQVFMSEYVAERFHRRMDACFEAL